MTVREAAAILGMTRINVLARLKRGTIKGQRIPAPTPSGFYWLIPESEVTRVKEERK